MLFACWLVAYRLTAVAAVAVAAAALLAILAILAVTAARHVAHGHVGVLGDRLAGVLGKAQAAVNDLARALERGLANVAAGLQEVVERRIDAAKDSLASAASVASHSMLRVDFYFI